MYNLFITTIEPANDTTYFYKIKVVTEKNNGNSTTVYDTCTCVSQNGQVMIFDRSGPLEMLPISKTRIKYMREGK